MASVLLKRWETIEIFCELINKDQQNSSTPDKNIEWSDDEIEKYIEVYSVSNNSKDFSDRNKLDDKNLMSYISQGIEKAYLFSIGKERLKSAFRLLNEGLEKKKEKFLISDYMDIPDELIDSAQRSFENTFWYIFYNDKTRGETKVPGVSQGIISLLPFGRAELKRPSLGNSPNSKVTHVKYTGRYSVYSNERNMLSLSLKMNKHFRDLRITVCVGEKDPEIEITPDDKQIALGVYTNIYEGRMECGSVVLQRIKDVEEIDIIKKVKKDDYDSLLKFTSDLSSIDQGLMDFFTKKTRNMVIPKYIYSLSDLKIEINKGEGF